jgi:hypothetical protein
MLLTVSGIVISLKSIWFAKASPPISSMPSGKTIFFGGRFEKSRVHSLRSSDTPANAPPAIVVTLSGT